MKGLVLSEEYYRKFGTKMIAEKFPQYKGRIAVGLVGDGSECYGFDDEISRDHDWGPGFCLWLTKTDYQKIGRQLQAAYDELPKEFLGFRRLETEQGKGRVGVFEIGEFYRRFLGRSHAPKSIDAWLYLRAEAASPCTNGKVFSDPLGKFSQIREELLAFYPEDVRLLKIAGLCISCGQTGQYNFMRSVKRKEYFASQYAETKFCADIISLIFLLNRRYSPYYKWRHRALLTLTILGDFVHTKIGRMMETSDHYTKSLIIEEISMAVIAEFKKQDLSHSGTDFLVDHATMIQRRISNPKLSEMRLWR